MHVIGAAFPSHNMSRSHATHALTAGAKGIAKSVPSMYFACKLLSFGYSSLPFGIRSLQATPSSSSGTLLFLKGTYCVLHCATRSVLTDHGCNVIVPPVLSF